MGLPTSKDTRLLAAGVTAFVALAAYLGVALANTHALAVPGAPGVTSKVAPWTPSGSKLTPARRHSGGYDVLVTPVSPGGKKAEDYGAIVQTLVPDPAAGRTYVVGLWLKGSPRGRLGFELNEFRPGVAKYPVETTIRVTSRWRHFTFRTPVKGKWLGLAVYVYRANQRRQTSFSVRGVTAAVRGR